MKKYFNLLLLIIMAFATSCAQGAIVTAENVEKEVIKQISNHLEEYELERYEVKVMHIPFTKMNVAGDKIELKVNKLNTKNITSKAIARVAIYSDGQYAKSVGIPIAIKAYQNVYVAKYNIEKNETITEEKVTKKAIDIANNTHQFLTENELKKGVSAMKNIAADEVLISKFTRYVPDVEKNSIVKVIVSNDSITVTTEATALSSGNIGDRINLQNKELKKVYSGRIIGENKVLVKI